MKESETILKLPNHIAYIIDGNGRWAKARGLSRSLGHKAGFNNLKKILKESFYNYGIKYVSVYAFSTENWNRPKAEVDYLIDLFTDYVSNDFMKQFPKVKLNIMGDYTVFPDKLQENANKTIEATKDETDFVLNLGINYGGRDEIVYAVNKLISNGETNVTKEKISGALYTANIPDPDFIIRTSGEQRLSNFMLWQCSYSELYFPKVHWPSFGKKELKKALVEYTKRDRRFGKIIETN